MFEVGLPKMATRSLAAGLQIHLGITGRHGVAENTSEGKQFVRALRTGRVARTSFAKRTEYVGGHLYPWHGQLRSHFPSAVFLWPTRPLRKWLDSCRRHWSVRNVTDGTLKARWRQLTFCGAIEYHQPTFRFVWKQYHRERAYWLEADPEHNIAVDVARDMVGDITRQIDPAVDPRVPFPRARRGRDYRRLVGIQW